MKGYLKVQEYLSRRLLNFEIWNDAIRQPRTLKCGAVMFSKVKLT
jgi:hypothetical protein